MRAHDWVSGVERPVAAETADGATRDQPAGEASPGGKEEEEEEMRKEDGEARQGGEEQQKEEEKKNEAGSVPRSVEVRSTRRFVKSAPFQIVLIFLCCCPGLIQRLCVCVCV